ncbi:MAG: hypothetical protein DCC75_07225 [Proteobacteria bacterium]|nr:MAG: hypothetical protein DCC75_07225 [Pseudomonadota bacterium]
MNNLSLADLCVIAVYILLTLSIGVLARGRQSVDTYLANDRATPFALMLCSTVATWVGAGAIIGVCSAAYTSGISYGISVIFVNIGWFLLFSFLCFRIKEFGDKSGSYTLGDFIGHSFGPRVRLLFAVSSLVVMVIWTAVQLLAVGNLCALLFGWSLTSGLVAALVITLVYSAAGGLRSDIITDFIQFWVMLAAFVLIIPFATKGGAALHSLSELPDSFFDPMAFGGAVFFFGSLVLGMLYPLSNTVEWQRVYAAGSPSVARRAYLWSVPFIFFFVGIAIIVGLFAARHFPGLPPDQSFIYVMQNALPAGVRGLAIASIVALVCSSVDSLLVSAAAVMARDLLPIATQRPLNSWIEMRKLRLLSVLFGAVCLLVAIAAPSIVELSIFGAFLYLCFSATVLAALFGWKVSPRAVQASIYLGISGLAVSWVLIGKNSFVVVVFVTFLPLLERKGSKTSQAT